MSALAQTMLRGVARPAARCSAARPARNLRLPVRAQSAPTQRSGEAGEIGEPACSTSGSSSGELWWRSLASLDLTTARPGMAAALVVMGLAMTADAASAADLGEPMVALHAQPLAELAEQDFWGNIARYGRYFVTVMLGTGYVMLRPLQAMLKKPVTAVFAIAALVALVLGTRIALEYMLGINEYAYNPENFRIATTY